MLSFDVTDRKIRIIKGTESNGKIKISAAAEIALEEAVIVNGHVNDINRVAVLINQVLKSNNMPDKEAIVAISSNQTVFKELLITPNPKESEFMKEIRTQLQVQINVDDSYSVAYVIVGDPEDDENGEKKQRVLVTACPYDVVECYKRIFHMLGITLKTVMIGCNAITKVLLADSKVKAKMPLLAVQIDSDFISLNLYENNQLSFSRFASIDPEDYDNPDDYVFEAVNENIFRMLQFARSRGTDDIQNIVFYGDINVSPNLYNRLIDELSHNELTVSQINVPPQIHGYQNLEFSVYANAIGAMFKRNKLTEHINLLEVESQGAAAGKVKADKSFPLFAALGVGVSLVCVLGAWGVLAAIDGKVKLDTAKLKADIESPETAAGLQQYEDLQVMRDTVNAYADQISNAKAAYESKPVLVRDYYEAIDEALTTVLEEQNGAAEEGAPAPTAEMMPPTITDVEYENGTFTFPVTLTTNEEFSQKYPAALVQYLYDKDGDKFSYVEYTGYTAAPVPQTEENPDASGYVVGFELKVQINNEKQLPDFAAEAKAEADAEAAESDTGAAEAEAEEAE
ncbi:MAG: pilus assembly protein PilM [Eubacterium sp.]|nr:pilus assembly protein PilM [Eubacterium sp.]